jgi:glycosyltransferase involved in cell wall biosynthesis
MLVEPVARAVRVPLLVHFHGYDVSRLTADPTYLSSLRALFARMAMAITVSEEMRARVMAVGCPPARVRCHHTGVPDAYFAREPRRRLPSVRFTLLQVGRLAEVKGHHLSMGALARVATSMPGVVLRFVGDGHLRLALERQATGLGIAGRVQFAGSRQPADVIEEMRQADALIMPSCRAPDGGVEGLPNAVVEAMAGGLPVIATRHGGIPEALVYDDPDWLIPEEAAIEGLAARIRQLASDMPLWHSLSERGRQIARERFHLPTQNRKLDQLYREILPAR